MERSLRGDRCFGKEGVLGADRSFGVEGCPREIDEGFGVERCLGAGDGFGAEWGLEADGGLCFTEV